MDALNEERLMCIEEELVKQGQKLDKLETGVQRLEDANAKQENAIDGLKADTREMLEMFRSLQGAFRVLEYIGKLAKPLGAIFGFIAAGVALWKGFGK